MDIEFMKQLHDKVNVIPVIAKADTLTPAEVKALKKRVSDGGWRESTSSECKGWFALLCR